MHDKQPADQRFENDYHGKDNALEIGSLALHEAIESEQSMEKDTFDLTDPEQRAFSPYENYRFLVHVPLNGVDNRAAEIGTERGGVLMTSLVSNTRTATFEGQGGIIVAQPNAVTGSAPHDNGDEIRSGAKATVDELLRPQGNGDYNQVDMKFDSTKPVGVMIKRAASDGRELGSKRINESLKTYASRNDLPIAEVIVLPDGDMPTEAGCEVTPNADGTALLTVTVPGGDEHYYRAQVLRGSAYHTENDEAMAARIMKITAYGETFRELDPKESTDIEAALVRLLESAAITDADMKALVRELA